MQIVSVLLILGILTILGTLEPFGFLKPWTKIQFWLFGYLGYLWLFVVAFWVYHTKNPPNFKNNRFLEKTLGVIIGIFALLVLQGLFLSKLGFWVSLLIASLLQLSHILAFLSWFYFVLPLVLFCIVENLSKHWVKCF